MFRIDVERTVALFCVLGESVSAFPEALKLYEVFITQIAEFLSDLLLKQSHITLEMEDVTTLVSCDCGHLSLMRNIFNQSI